jgi:uncharacterized membrane protein
MDAFLDQHTDADEMFYVNDPAPHDLIKTGESLRVFGPSWGLLGARYGVDFFRVDGQMKLQPIPGIISQVLVVSALMVITVMGVRSGQGYPVNVLLGAMGGVLAISVYGLVNQALIDSWAWRLTILEVIWGPIIGGLGGLFIAWMYRALKP